MFLVYFIKLGLSILFIQKMGIFTNFYWIIIVPIGVIVERLLFKVNFYRFDKNNPLDVNLNDTQPHPK